RPHTVREGRPRGWPDGAGGWAFSQRWAGVAREVGTMDRTPRIPPPSAMDGYRRLARTRSGEPIVRTVAAEDLPPRRRVGASRLAGALRLAGFLSVIAVIVGTSVTLASADPDETTTREPARTP